MRALRLFAVVPALLVSSACQQRLDVQCQQDGNCNLASGGICLAAETGSRWCAYPDAACASGYRFSNDDVGDGVGGSCSANLPVTLTVDVSGNGAGRVTSMPTGIDCPGTCSATFAKGSNVTLSETSNTSVFMGWSDACTSDCTLTMDANRHVGAQFAVPGSSIWASQLHASNYGAISAAKTLSNNDVVIAGYFIGTISLGATSLVSASDGTAQSSFVARLRGSDGSPVWSTKFDSTQSVTVAQVDADAHDDVFISGLYLGTATFNGTSTTSAGSTDVFVAKLSGTDGHYAWAHTFGDPSLELVAGLGVDHAGDVTLTGFFSGTIAPGPSPLTGTNATFVVKYNGATGAHVWSKAIVSDDTTVGDSPSGLAIDANGNVVVLGTFRGSINFGGGTVTASAQAVNAFLVKYAADNGAYIFDREVATSVASVSTDAAGNMYLLGTFAGTLAIAPQPLNSSGDQDVFIAKFSPSGAPLWARSFGNGLRDEAIHLGVDAAGDPLLSAAFRGTISYGGSSFVAAGDSDVIVARLRSSDGGHLGSVQLGGTSGESAWATSGGHGSVFIGGQFRGSAGFGGETLTSPNSSYDGVAMLVAPLNPE